MTPTPAIPKPLDVPAAALLDVRKSFGSALVLRGVSLTVPVGQVACLIGPSGSGKTTLLRCINHLEIPDAGEIRVYGQLVGYEERGDLLYESSERKIAERRAQIGMVFQRFNLFPHMTAMHNVTMGLRVVRHISRAQAEAEGRALLERVGLGDRTTAYPSELSGGQQQRVAIARALAMRPKLMLFDEPTSALDPELVGEVLEVIRDLAEEGMTMIIVTHEMRFADDVADTVYFMEDGLIVEAGAPALVLHDPRNARTREFLARVL